VYQTIYLSNSKKGFMKKITFLALLFIFSNIIYAQSWVDIGLKGGYGLDFLINKNISTDETHSSTFAFGYTYGGKLGWNFNEAHAVTLDVLYTGFGKNYEYYTLNPTDSTKKNFYTKNFKFNSLDFLLMYRHVKNASYFEIGPMVSSVKKASATDNQPGSKFDGDISDNLVKTNYSAVIGAGGMLAGTENFRVILGFRVMYTFNDIVSADGQKYNFPSGNKYNSYSQSNPISAMMVMEFNYDLGFLAKSNCKKKKRSFMLFKN
jgi:hypothetical protein